MVALDPLLHQLAFDVRDLRQHCGKRRRINRRFVSRRQTGCDLGTLDRLRQERGSRGSIACGADVNVDDLPVLVDCPEGVTPPSGNPDIRLIDTSALSQATATRARLTDTVE